MKMFIVTCIVFNDRNYLKIGALEYVKHSLGRLTSFVE